MFSSVFAFTFSYMYLRSPIDLRSPWFRCKLTDFQFYEICVSLRSALHLCVFRENDVPDVFFRHVFIDFVSMLITYLVKIAKVTMGVSPKQG